MEHYGSETWTSLGVGVAIGLVLISLLTLYPGEPFEYTPDALQRDASPSVPTPDDDDKRCLPAPPLQAADADERSAAAARVEKIQALLGLQEAEIQSALAAAQRATPPRPTATRTNYMAIADKCVYAVFLGLLLLVAEREYGINVAAVLSYVFPREAATVHQLWPWTTPVHAAP
ncbi:hypothetical protein SPRG_01875 [Saprolegnia parasitica CBS 223.65]|uniref:Uncharacterized protein n=1 Tax=Saprolegnia parasitica (strain CBS 223.65) TaxID=695850 RepID=A0A067CUX6_SAPPC|nr:hypothetical protein SPRG_01875 [Saprolegnia parasitica CBS 223.65]KDO33060.1 hypothetical protein SPRG_01875 [Saprolegnia parasitica CBS 223.65]|eukprot:XP_012195831.1 hypothetical protein SPRG_01875 [Saprolegnia parasitica CBS 223.65]